MRGRVQAALLTSSALLSCAPHHATQKGKLHVAPSLDPHTTQVYPQGCVRGQVAILRHEAHQYSAHRLSNGRSLWSLDARTGVLAACSSRGALFTSQGEAMLVDYQTGAILESSRWEVPDLQGYGCSDLRTAPLPDAEVGFAWTLTPHHVRTGTDMPEEKEPRHCCIRGATRLDGGASEVVTYEYHAGARYWSSAEHACFMYTPGARATSPEQSRAHKLQRDLGFLFDLPVDDQTRDVPRTSIMQDLPGGEVLFMQSHHQQCDLSQSVVGVARRDQTGSWQLSWSAPVYTKQSCPDP